MTKASNEPRKESGLQNRRSHWECEAQRCNQGDHWRSAQPWTLSLNLPSTAKKQTANALPTAKHQPTSPAQTPELENSALTWMQEELAESDWDAWKLT